MYYESLLPSGNFLVNIKSRQDNHDKHVLESFYQSSLSVLESYLLSPFPKGGRMAPLFIGLAG